MKIIFLKGSYEDIAREFFNSSEKARENLFYYKKLKENVFVRNCRNFFKKIIIRKIHQFYSSCFSKRLDKDFINFVKVFGIESGLKEKDFLSLVVFPDVLTYLFSKFPTLKLPHNNLGCSSVIKKYDNGIEHGRNLDFFGGNIWSNYHEVIVVFPDKGLKYITVCAEGFFSPGITAINESFISLSLHMLYTDDLNKKGMPILNIMYNLLTQAKCFDDIREILKNNKPISGWGIVASNHKTGEISIFELTGSSFKEYKIEEDNFCYVNNYITELKKREYLFSYAWIKNNFCRFNRMNELLKNGEEIFEILSDRTDNGLLKEFLGGFTIANNFTISSAIFNSKNDELLVAANKVPASVGKYKKYVLSELFHGKVIEKEEVFTKNSREIDRGKISILVDAYDKYIISGKTKKFIKEIENIQIFPSNLFISIMYCKLGKFKKAKKIIEEILKDKIFDDYRYASILFLKGIILDILKNREEAIEIYRELLNKYRFVDINFWCLKFLNKPAKKSIIEQIDINLFLSHYIIVG